MPNPVYVVEIADTSPASLYVAIEDAVSHISIHRAMSTAFEPLQTGRLELLVDNYAGDFSPENAASSYTNLLKANRAVRVRAVYDGVEYPLFTGFLDSFRVDPNPDRRTTHLQASDRVKDLLLRRIDLPLSVDMNPSSLAVDVLSAANVSSADRTVDAMTDTIPFAWFKDYEPLRALDDLVQFGFYKLFVGTDGKVNFRNRYVDLAGTVVGSYINDFFGFTYDLNDERIANLVRVRGLPRKVSANVNTVAWLAEKPTIAASGFLGFFLDFVDPATIERNTPATSVSVVRSTDWLFNTSSDGLGTDRTATSSASTTIFGASVVCTLFNGSADTVYVTKFQVRGYAAQRQPEVLKETANSSSQNVYGKRHLTIESPLIGGLFYADDYAAYLLESYREPHPTLAVTLKNQFPDVLARDLTHTIAVVESLSAVGSSWSVTGVEHDIALGAGTEHTLTMATEVWTDRQWLVLDDPVLGVLDSRKLAF